MAKAPGTKILQGLALNPKTRLLIGLLAGSGSGDLRGHAAKAAGTMMF